MLNKLLFISTMLVLACSCNEEYTPKPRIYPRINFPERSYQVVEHPCPFQFQTPVYAVLSLDTAHYAESCWQNLYFPGFNATLHLTYHALDKKGKLDELSEESRQLVYRHHTLKAEEITENYFENPKSRTYGIIYELEGNTATAYQFYVSDSSKHFLRGVLYFNSKTESDSIAPMLEFIKSDIDRLIYSLNWKN